jgi:glycerol-3-phosphate dehydrogenase (NAD(P)+)
MKVTILGSGAYGIALSLMFNKNNCDITIWERFEDKAKDIIKHRENKQVLPGVKIPDNIKITTDLEDSIVGSELIVIAIPAGFVDEVTLKIKDIVSKEQHICIASKGIEQDTCLFVDDVVRKYIKSKKIAVISGPSFAVDIAKYVPIGLTIASKCKKTIKVVKKGLENDTLKLRETDDMIGTEICGSIKNVMAIASGMLDGMGLPESTQAMFITESLHDIKELIKALGGEGKTVLSFAGFGDLLLTCTSTKSRNFTFGKIIGEKRPKNEIDNYIANTTIEGLYTLKSIHKLIKNKKVDIPIVDLVYDIVFNNEDPEELKKFLIKKQ